MSFYPGDKVKYVYNREVIFGGTIDAWVLECSDRGVKISVDPVEAHYKGWHQEFWVPGGTLHMVSKSGYRPPTQPTINPEDVEYINRNCKPEDLPEYKPLFNEKVVLVVFVIAILVMYNLLT